MRAAPLAPIVREENLQQVVHDVHVTERGSRHHGALWWAIGSSLATMRAAPLAPIVHEANLQHDVRDGRTRPGCTIKKHRGVACRGVGWTDMIACTCNGCTSALQSVNLQGSRLKQPFRHTSPSITLAQKQEMGSHTPISIASISLSQREEMGSHTPHLSLPGVEGGKGMGERSL